MNLYHRICERVLNDEPQVPFDAEPSDLTLIDPDDYDPRADVGDSA